jgi:hypothetical protein
MSSHVAMSLKIKAVDDFSDTDLYLKAKIPSVQWILQLKNMQLSAFMSSSLGARGSVMVKALCYKPEDRGFDTRWGDFFKFT